MATRSGFRLEPRLLGTALCVVGMALLWMDALIAAALGIELLATAFWVWARAADDASEQVPRWAWLRRPATALWLAVAIHAILPHFTHAASRPASGTPEMLQWIEAIAVVWAGLELMAALPIARPYSDLPGPLLSVRPWLPVMLPAAGFLVLWRHAPHWIAVREVGQTAVFLLLLTALLGALRAFARRSWTASLRWLAVTDSALAAMLVALRALPPSSTFLLWLAACGAHASLLAGELFGAVTRRGPVTLQLWRAASWIALLALTWPVLVAWGFGEGGVPELRFLGASLPAALAAWITLGRMKLAPERRRVVRPSPAAAVSQVLALLIGVLGPVALALAWWSGFEPPWPAWLLALSPVALSGAVALAAHEGAERMPWSLLHRVGSAAPPVAGQAYRTVIELERRLVDLLRRIVRWVAAPLRDLHTGDAQEYLLFLVGLGVLALVLPLLQ